MVSLMFVLIRAYLGSSGCFEAVFIVDFFPDGFLDLPSGLQG